MKQILRKGCALSLIIGTVVIGGCAVVATSSAYRTTPFGHVVRWVEGEDGAEQTANDLADEIQSRVGTAKLQQWAVGVLAYAGGHSVHTGNRPLYAGGATYWPFGTVGLGQVKVPSFLLHKWPQTPKVFARLSPIGQKSLDITWGCMGSTWDRPIIRQTTHITCGR